MAELIALIFGALSSGVFKLWPQLDEWFQGRTPAYRGFFMLGLSLIAPALLLGVSCIDLFNVTTCDINGVKEAGRVWVAFVGANLGIFLMTPDSPAKSKAKVKAETALVNRVANKVEAQETQEYPQG